MRIVNDIAVALATYLEEDVKNVAINLSPPPRPEMGDVAFPCFRLAKRFRKSPHDIANDLKVHFETDECAETVDLLTKIERIETASGISISLLSAIISRNRYCGNLWRAATAPVRVLRRW